MNNWTESLPGVLFNIISMQIICNCCFQLRNWIYLFIVARLAILLQILSRQKHVSYANEKDV
jgi:hypothetical protein